MRTASVAATGRLLNAYREAAAQNAAQIEADDGTWLRVGALLERAGQLDPLERGPLLESVRNDVRNSIGGEFWTAGHWTDPSPPADAETLESRLRVYCERIEDVGALGIADAILTAYLTADPQLGLLECGRVEAVRARLAWKRGDLDVADERYRRVGAQGRRVRQAELQIRALNGEAIVARLRGDYPRCRARGERAVKLAESAGLMRLSSVAHQTLMVAAAVANDFVAAVDHGWYAFVRAEGEVSMEVAALGNIGQLFLDAGHPATAASAFAAVMHRHPAERVLLPALGGLALAAARLERFADLERVTQEILGRTDVIVHSAAYDLAVVMLDLATAHGSVGRTSRASEFRGRASRIASAYGYHELAIRAEQSPNVPVSAPSARALLAQTKVVAGKVQLLVGA